MPTSSELCWGCVRGCARTGFGRCLQVPFKVLPREELQKQRQQAILDVTSVLDIPEDAAVRVLRKYKW